MKLFITIILLFFSLNIFAQCRQKYIYECISSIDTCQIYLRDFSKNIYYKKSINKNRFSFVGNENTKYNIYIFSDEHSEDSDVILYLCDKRKFDKSQIIDSTSNKSKPIEFITENTGFYYIFIKCSDKNCKDCCSVGILNFEKCHSK